MLELLEQASLLLSGVGAKKIDLHLPKDSRDIINNECNHRMNATEAEPQTDRQVSVYSCGGIEIHLHAV